MSKLFGKLDLWCMRAHGARGIASAQTTNATIVGDVTRSRWSRIAGAVITVKNAATGVAVELKTDETGSYRVFPLNPGTYEVTASAPGFSTQVQQNVVLDAAANVKVDFRLEVGVVSEKVEVQATATVLQTQDASVGGTVTGNEVARLPVNGRNYTRLILLMPGTSDQGGSQSNGTFSGTQMISVNGQRRQDNNFTVDGVDNNFMMMNSPGMSPSMDAIQEFRVLDNTSAEFGRSSGSNVNIVIKSGTRNLHGSAYEYLRNDKFDANDFFANKQNTGKVPFRQNQYGVAVGGPVVIPKIYHGRDKTFWFFNWEGYRARRGQTNISSFPDCRPSAMAISPRSPKPSTIRSPAWPDRMARSSVSRSPATSFPQAMISPAMKFWLDTMIPLPTRPGLTNNFVNTQGYSNDRDAIQGPRRPQHRLQQDCCPSAGAGSESARTSPAATRTLSQLSRFDVDNMMASWNHIFSPTTVLEVKFGRNVPTASAAAGQHQNPAQGFPDQSPGSRCSSRTCSSIRFPLSPPMASSASARGGQITGRSHLSVHRQLYQGHRPPFAQIRRELQPPPLLHEHHQSDGRQRRFRPEH